MEKNTLSKVVPIGFFYDGITPFEFERFDGIMRFAKSHPEWIVRPCDLGVDNPERELARFLHLPVRGILLGNLDPANLERLLRHQGGKVPIVAIGTLLGKGNRPEGGVNGLVYADIDEAVETAVQFGLARKFRHFAFMGTAFRNIRHYAERTRETFETLAARGGAASFSAFSPAWTSSANVSLTGITRLRRWLEKLPKPCFLLSAFPESAKLLLDACRVYGIQVPEQISILNISDNPVICENMTPTLSSIALPIRESSFFAAEMLSRMLAGGIPAEPVVRRFHVSGIVERGSTSDARGAARLATLAQEYIRVHARLGLSVADVARHLNVSRRTLEYRFRETLGVSVKERIDRERLRLARQRLRKSGEPLSDVASFSGFRSTDALIDTFRRVLGMTPGEWRAKNAAGAAPAWGVDATARQAPPTP